MATYTEPEFYLVYINSNGDIVTAFRAEWFAPAFADYGDYLIPYVWTWK
jgi:hypothetical protein